MNVEIVASPVGNDDGFPPPPAPGTVPLLDRPDFLEGSIDALTRLLGQYEDHVEDVRNEHVEAVLLLGNTEPDTDIESYAQDLDAGAALLGTAIREELQQLRWKLARIQKAQVAR